MSVPDRLLEVAEELYGGSFDDFTTARNAAAKAAGDKELATAVKALRKPVLAAWVVNMLVRYESDQVAQVLALGASLREAQAGLQGEQLRELTRQRRRLTSAVTTQARSLAIRLGQKVTGPVADQVEATLTAAMIDEVAAQAVQSGLLVQPIVSTGVELIDPAAVLAIPDALGRVAPARDQPRPELQVVAGGVDERARVRAEEREAAERRVAEARAAVEEARAGLAEMGARNLARQSEAEELRRRLATLEDELEEASGEYDEQEAAVAEAEAELVEAEAELGRLS